MGLDVSGYSEKEHINYYELNDGDLQYDDWDTHTQVWINPHFRDRATDLINKSVYKFKDSKCIRAGSYSSYNLWREELARLLGYPCIKWDTGYKGVIDSCQASACQDEHSHMPLMELLNFSDAEGAIGTIISSKIYRDLTKYQQMTLNQETKHHAFNTVYNLFIDVFQLASNDGFVRFH